MSTTRIAVMTDVHANLPALDAALADIESAGVDMIVHTGDAVGYGPYPVEVLERMLATPGMRFVLGNHDRYLLEWEPGQTEGVVAFDWFFGRVSPSLREAVAAWPYVLREQVGRTSVGFVHYPLTASGDDWRGSIENGMAGFREALRPLHADIVFFGHTHTSEEIKGQPHCVNPGSLGVSKVPLARYALLTADQVGWTIEHRSVPYDDAELFAGFARAGVPDWQMYAQLIYGRSIG